MSYVKNVPFEYMRHLWVEPVSERLLESRRAFDRARGFEDDQEFFLTLEDCERWRREELYRRLMPPPPLPRPHATPGMTPRAKPTFLDTTLSAITPRDQDRWGVQQFTPSSSITPRGTFILQQNFLDPYALQSPVSPTNITRARRHTRDDSVIDEAVAQQHHRLFTPPTDYREIEQYTNHQAFLNAQWAQLFSNNGALWNSDSHVEHAVNPALSEVIPNQLQRAQGVPTPLTSPTKMAPRLRYTKDSVTFIPGAKDIVVGSAVGDGEADSLAQDADVLMGLVQRPRADSFGSRRGSEGGVKVEKVDGPDRGF